jgi:hypothetical protein
MVTVLEMSRQRGRGDQQVLLGARSRFVANEDRVAPWAMHRIPTALPAPSRSECFAPPQRHEAHGRGDDTAA